MRASCRALHLERGSPPIGSAPVASAWVLLDLPRPWPARVETLPAVERLRSVLKQSGSNARLAVTLPLGEPRLRVYERVGGLTRGAVLPMETEAEEVLDFLASTLPAPPEELVLVCCHGRRDPCCGELGPGVAEALRREGIDARECSHLGGHRFAPTVVTFPDFRCYGRLEAAQVPRFVERLRSGVPQPEHYRGATYLEEWGQVAEAAVWERTGQRPLRSRVESRDAAGVVIACDPQGRFRVQVEELEYAGAASCSDLPEGATTTLSDYRAISLTIC